MEQTVSLLTHRPGLDHRECHVFLLYLFVSIYALILDEYRRKKNPLEGRLQKKKTPLKVFDHQIHQKLATDVIGVSFDAQ